MRKFFQDHPERRKEYSERMSRNRLNGIVPTLSDLTPGLVVTCTGILIFGDYDPGFARLCESLFSSLKIPRKFLEDEPPQGTFTVVSVNEGKLHSRGCTVDAVHLLCPDGLVRKIEKQSGRDWHLEFKDVL